MKNARGEDRPWELGDVHRAPKARPQGNVQGNRISVLCGSSLLPSENWVVSARTLDKQLFGVKGRGGRGSGPTVGEEKGREGKQQGPSAVILTALSIKTVWQAKGTNGAI